MISGDSNKKTFLETQGNSLNFILGIRTNDSQ